MIDRSHGLPVTRQARELGISRGSVYYLPRPTSVADLAVMRRLDELHMNYPFAGSRMLRDLLGGEGVKVGRLHVSSLMKKMAIEAIYRRPNTSKPAPGHKIYPYLLRKLAVTRPNQVWATDITPDQVRGGPSIPMARGFVYSAGSCTLAAERMAARLKAAGFADKDINVFEPPGHPREGGVIATLNGSDPKARPILLLAHIDVVEAKREDWTRDPFTLIEENGYFYGRGTVDEKPQAAIWTDTMIRLKAGTPPRRTIKMALSCGEEGGGTIVGAEWLAKEHKDWIDAEFALNEGGIGSVDAAGKPVSLAMQAGEKVFQDFRIEATNPGGHSSLPRPDNAIYDLSAALLKIGAYEFPVQFTYATRAYFAPRAKIDGGDAGAAMTRLLADPADMQADGIVSKNPSLHSMLRTTCVATLSNAGYANNVLPQRATANVNCRMFPGDPIENVRAQLVKAIDNPAVTVTPVEPISPTPPPPPLTDAIYAPALALAKVHFPGVPVLPTLVPGATDGRFLNVVGIPTYGVPGAMLGPTGDGMHGLNEKKSVAGLYAERDYLFDLVKTYAGVK